MRVLEDLSAAKAAQTLLVFKSLNMVAYLAMVRWRPLQALNHRYQLDALASAQFPRMHAYGLLFYQKTLSTVSQNSYFQRTCRRFNWCPETTVQRVAEASVFFKLTLPVSLPLNGFLALKLANKKMKFEKACLDREWIKFYFCTKRLHLIRENVKGLGVGGLLENNNSIVDQNIELLFSGENSTNLGCDNNDTSAVTKVNPGRERVERCQGLDIHDSFAEFRFRNHGTFLFELMSRGRNSILHFFFAKILQNRHDHPRDLDI